MTLARRKSTAAVIRLLILDVDGVLTDGRLYYGVRGEQLQCFSTKDGHGLKSLAHAGVSIAIISGRRSAAVRRRCRELGIRHLVEGSQDKVRDFRVLAAKLAVTAAQCAFIGDDSPDVALLREVGLAFAVADAHASAKAAAHHVTRSGGGCGAVREVCDRLLAARH
ncbi:MAG TPA: HAD hydrolase family protein [Steroidobacteraceae bacterium]|jgi:3-deoxy-D-manno-octulosonate 8-phosphate phosphatase (KDO 8-P phosphatase)